MNITNHKFPKKLGATMFALMSEGIKMGGTFDPGKIFHFFEESMTVDQAKTAWGFLSWCHANDKKFGHGNYEDRYKEFLAYRK